MSLSLSVALIAMLLAGASGFVVATLLSRARARLRQSGPLAPDYFHGLNYLLDEQPDLAIDAITNTLAVNDDTVETHLLLGRLVRRQGDVDKAIRMHRQLLVAPNVSRAKRALIELELGRDYLGAGLLERAEPLLVDVARHGGVTRGKALELLLEVYQREREWEHAVEAAEAMGDGSEVLAPTVAHYLCELADVMLVQGETRSARKYVQRALAKDERCVRAWLLIARIEEADANHRAAIRALRRVPDINPQFVREMLDALDRCYQAMHAEHEFLRYLDNLVTRVPSCTAMVRRAEYHEREAGSSAAREFIEAQLVRRPSVRGLHALLRFYPTNVEDANVVLLRRFTEAMLVGKPVYRCESCGFSAQSLHWLCPKCRTWGAVAPILGLEGD